MFVRPNTTNTVDVVRLNIFFGDVSSNPGSQLYVCKFTDGIKYPKKKPLIYANKKRKKENQSFTNPVFIGRKLWISGTMKPIELSCTKNPSNGSSKNHFFRQNTINNCIYIPSSESAAFPGRIWKDKTQLAIASFSSTYNHKKNIKKKNWCHKNELMYENIIKTYE